MHERLEALSEEQRSVLFEDLFVLSMSQLRLLCEHYMLPSQGRKVLLIGRLKQYLLTGQCWAGHIIPSASRACKGQVYELAPETLILYGAYKNNRKTRVFLKSLIGRHFHFTAAGIDWITGRWHDGNPPTYGEFAAWWRADYQRGPRPLKKEWAFLNFVRAHPHLPQREVLELWKQHRADISQRVFALLLPENMSLFVALKLLS